jgi:hypothetical protein
MTKTPGSEPLSHRALIALTGREQAMVNVIFFGIMLLGISIMGLWSGRQERLRRVEVREAAGRRPRTRSRN